MSAQQALNDLLRIRARAAVAAREVAIRGSDPFYRTPYRAGETAAAALAATGIAANDIWELRTGRRQQIEIAVREAAATLRSSDYTLQKNDTGAWQPAPVSPHMAHMREITQPWRTRDGRWFLPHFNLPHLGARVLKVLDCGNTAAEVSAAVARWNADSLEQAIATARACGGKVRTTSEWLLHP